MKTQQEIDWLAAQIKLFTGHLKEWKTLLSVEKQTRRSLKQDHEQQKAGLALMNLSDRKTASVQLVTRQVAELTRLTGQHSAEHQLMQNRQQQEQTNLDMLIKAQRSALS